VARPIVLSNGELHVGLNKYGIVHDFYYPYVGFENHAAGSQLRHKIGVFVDGAISWLDSGDWEFTFGYPHTALIGNTRAINTKIGVLLDFDDCVDADMSVFLRNIHVVNQRDAPREIKLFMHQAFAIGDSRSNTDTVQYLPDSDAILHYRGRRAFIISGTTDDVPFDQYTMGLFGIENHEGSFKDAEDGQLERNNVEHGRVDSIIGFTLAIDAHSSKRVQYWVAAGMSTREALFIHRQVLEDGVHARVHQTALWWHRWLEPGLNVLDQVPKDHRQLFLQSLMIMKSQMDKRGAIIASTDSTMLNYSRDAYAYSWGRDGGFVLWPLIRLGYKEEPYRFFDFCRRGMHPAGYVMHKYRADGALGSSWHPYVHGDIVAAPLQEDETAIVLFTFAQFYQMQQDPTLIKDFYGSMITPMAEFLAEYVDNDTGLPKPSYDLWEQDFMVTTFSTSVTYAGLLAAADLAIIAGDEAHAVKWRTAAEDIQRAAHKYLYNGEKKAFYKGIRSVNGVATPDPTVDMSSIFGAFLFGLFEGSSDEMNTSIATMIDIFAPTVDAPGLPRYEDDDYRRSDNSVTGNFWFITTLWHAQYKVEKEDTAGAMAILDWVKSHALSTGMLSEQVDPKTGRLIAPAPLTWSHAEYLSTILDLIERR